MMINFAAGIDVSGAGQPMIFLHSSLSSNKQWLMAIKQLAAHYTCINVDISGYGQAPGVPNEKDYSFSDEISRIEQTLKSLALTDEKLHLVGHSCGGAIALAMAVKMPDKVASMVLFEPVAFHLLSTYESSSYHQITQFAQQLKNMPDISAAQAFVNFWNGKGFFEALPIKVQNQMAKAMKKVHLDFQGILAERYQLGDLPLIKCPALIMCGENTQPVSRTLSGAVYQHLSKANLIEVRGGHMAPISHCEQVTKQLLTFLLKGIKKPGG